jgi:hypothetical protein
MGETCNTDGEMKKAYILAGNPKGRNLFGEVGIILKWILNR